MTPFSASFQLWCPMTPLPDLRPLALSSRQPWARPRSNFRMRCCDEWMLRTGCRPEGGAGLPEEHLQRGGNCILQTGGLGPGGERCQSGAGVSAVCRGPLAGWLVLVMGNGGEGWGEWWPAPRLKWSSQ